MYFLFGYNDEKQVLFGGRVIQQSAFRCCPMKTMYLEILNYRIEYPLMGWENIVFLTHEKFHLQEQLDATNKNAGH